MNATTSLKKGLGSARMVTNMILGGLEDKDLLVRPVEGANCIAWQLGHLIASENGIVSAVRPGLMPELPAGFREAYTSATAKSELSHPLSKDEYMRLYDEQRQATLRALDQVGDAGLDQPAPEKFVRMCATVGDAFQLVINHEVMHAGQFSVVRRKLGKPNVF